MRKVNFLVVGILLVVSLLLNGYLLWRSSGASDVLSPADAQWVSKALQHRADQERVPVETISRLNRASVIRFTDQICVGLSPAVGVAGGRSVVCFDSQDGRAVRSEAIGE